MLLLLTLNLLFLTQALCDIEGINFFLYQNTNPNEPIVFDKNVDVEELQISSENPIKILAHGWLDNGTLPWTVELKDTYMKSGIETFISMDWGVIADQFYPILVLSIPELGEIVSDMILNLHEKYKIPFGNFHLIGHSLGGHIMGFAGKRVIERSGSKIGRITGLDPAGPGFNLRPKSLRLSDDDAEFVDVIHTSVGGWWNSLGHADFWPNGGRLQRGCNLLDSCNHVRSRVYFNDSIRTNFVAWKCSSYEDFSRGSCFENERVLMGESCSTTARGNFYLDTYEEEPFNITPNAY